MVFGGEVPMRSSFSYEAFFGCFFGAEEGLTLRSGGAFFAGELLRRALPVTPASFHDREASGRERMRKCSD
jgi:hypothetical protein